MSHFDSTFILNFFINPLVLSENLILYRYVNKFFLFIKMIFFFFLLSIRLSLNKLYTLH